MGKFINLTGQRFSRLVVIKRAENDKQKLTQWLCQCDCGQQTIVRGSQLKNNSIRSCGCLYRESRKNNQYGYKHGYSNSRIYHTWNLMLQRCTNPNHTAYKNYGGRGIQVCEAWLKFEGFLQDMVERPYGMTLDRINNDGNYCKENCKWSTWQEQQRNRNNNKLITINGVDKCLAEWCEIYNLPYGRTLDRIRYGWTPEEALELQSKKKWQRKNEK